MKYDSANIFAKILRDEIPCEKLYEDEFALAFRDIAPAAPSHILVIPKREVTSFDDFAEQDVQFVGQFFASVRKVAAQEGLVKSGYRLITNHGADANQTVAHFHIHILGGTSLGGLTAEDAANR
ncbi:MAG: histidine triad nucleotide-binding protein [Rickettsiales bacterium]|nr:histidine triad nucleotide-binding protein [Rickettsiales bacterium]